ncbi:MAG: hypothetical protein GX434_17820 [Peptococcaceae bacterium]|nr:hypothetical protein [Peptococcaceae bacterium]
MKNTKKIILIIIFSLAFQWMVYALLNWKADELLNPFFRLNRSYSVDAELKNAHRFTLSYNNKFLSCISDNELCIINLTSNKKIKYKEDPVIAEGIILGYKWLPDRNSLLYVKKNPLTGVSSVYSLDLDEISVSGSGAGFDATLERTINFPMEQIFDIQISTYTNNLYFLYKDQEAKHKILKMDIMKNINRMDNPNEEINKIFVSNRFGNLFLESREGTIKTILSQLDRERTVLTEGEKNILLGCEDNKVYIGKLKDSLLEGIFSILVDPNGKKLQTQEIWQGEIPYDPVYVRVSADDKVMIQNTRRLDIIRADGKHDSRNMPEGTVVLSDTGKTFMQIIPGRDSLVYYWRSI